MIYLDNHATTQVDPRVARVVMRYMVEDFGNPSSVDHVYGDIAEKAVDDAKQHLTTLINAPNHRVIFTSGATESANIAIRGFVATRVAANSPIRIALSTVEHPAVAETCDLLQEEGFVKTSLVSTDSAGRIRIQELAELLREGIDLVCLMAANNVVGTVYPIAAVAELAHDHGANIFVDGTQAVGHTTVDLDSWDVDAFSLSAHKMYGPKGVGALVVKPGYPLRPLTTGGGQQNRIRPGTLNVPGIAGLGETCRFRSKELEQDSARIAALRDKLQRSLCEVLPEAVVWGDPDNRLPGNLSISVPNIPNQAVVARVRNQLCVSTGAACSSGIEQPSAVLRAMGVPSELAEGHLRFGVGKFNSAEEIQEAVELITQAVTGVRQRMGSRRSSVQGPAQDAVTQFPST